jgi:hypothetical protein
MNTLKAALFLIVFAFTLNVNAQEDTDTKQGTAYYQQRAAEDAKYEQEYQAKNDREDKAFWKEQKKYEKQLKKNNRRAYRAYIQGKNDAYAEHHQHCNHDHHSDYYYSNTRFYYYQYDNRRNYNRSTNRPIINTPVRVNTPSVRLGIF